MLGTEPWSVGFADPVRRHLAWSEYCIGPEGDGTALRRGGKSAYRIMFERQAVAYEESTVEGLQSYRRRLARLLDDRERGLARPQPLMPHAPDIDEAGQRSLRYRLSLRSAPYLIDHCIDGRPVLPMAAALEIIAQFVAAGWPLARVSEVRDLRVLSGIMLDGYQPLDLRLRGSKAEDSSGIVVEMLDAANSLPYYRAMVMLAPAYPPEPPALCAESLSGGIAVDASRTYRDLLFHGERFRGLRRIATLAPEGADAEVQGSIPEAFLGAAGREKRWLFDPALMDLPPQLAWVWSRRHRGMVALPSRFGRVRRFGSDSLPRSLSLSFRLKSASHSSLLYDAQFIDAQGRLRLLIEDGESTMTAALNRLAPDHPQFQRGLSRAAAIRRSG